MAQEVPVVLAAAHKQVHFLCRGKCRQRHGAQFPEIHPPSLNVEKTGAAWPICIGLQNNIARIGIDCLPGLFNALY
jgi:hypothetical protein